jgi:cytochrome b involved in lipid metabolism
MYTREEVSKHKTAASRVWVTHENKVYDITDFAKNHPGAVVAASTMA